MPTDIQHRRDRGVLAACDSPEVYGGGGYLYPDTIGELTGDEGVLERAQQCAEKPYFDIAALQYT